MKFKVYAVPTKEGYEFFPQEDSPYPDRLPMALPWLPPQPRVMETMARAFFQAQRRGEPFELELLTPKALEAPDLKQRIEAGLHETRFQDEKLQVSILNRASLFMLDAELHNYGFFRWFLGVLILGLAMGNPVRLGMGLYLIFGRPFLAGKVKESHDRELYGQVMEGIDLCYKAISQVVQREDGRLKKLEEVIHAIPDRKEAYIQAFHACDPLGLPQLKPFYAQRVPLDENKIEEPTFYFLLNPGDRAEVAATFPSTAYVGQGRKPAPGVELFDYSLNARELTEVRRYADLEALARQGAQEVGFEEVAVFTTPGGKVLWAFEIGNPQAGERILVKASCHGEEEAGPRTILQMMRSLATEGEYTARVLEGARLSFIPADDPEGFDMRGRAAVDMRGREEHNPVQRGRRFRDINASWGEKTRSLRIATLQQYIRQFRPTLALDLHESISPEHELQEWGAGLLSIEHLYLPLETRRELERVKTRFEMLTDFITEGVWRLRNPLRQRRVRKLMGRHPHFELGQAMMENIRRKGLRTYGGDYQNLFDRPVPFPPQLIFFDQGRCVEGPLLYEGEVRVFSAWVAEELGALGYTCETFPNPLDERVMEQMAYAEGGILYRLRLGRYGI